MQFMIMIRPGEGRGGEGTGGAVVDGGGERRRLRLLLLPIARRQGSCEAGTKDVGRGAAGGGEAVQVTGTGRHGRAQQRRRGSHSDEEETLYAPLRMGGTVSFGMTDEKLQQWRQQHSR
jgi:hypothetical protein